MEGKKPIVAPLKWPGGKRWLAPALVSLLGDVASYREPFLGGGAVFFALCPNQATLGDANESLIDTYTALKSDPERVIKHLARLRPVDEVRFKQVRDMEPRTQAGRAARMIYLNRTAFNGVYRVNQQGRFNVPFGHRPPKDLLTRDALKLASAALAMATLNTEDFRGSLAAARDEDVVYCDPPYTVMHNNNGFVRYNERLFSWEDQVELAESVCSLAAAGSRVIVSNAAHQPLEHLYASRALSRFRVRRMSRVAASAAARGWQWELLVVSKACGSLGQVRRHLESSGLDVDVV